MHRLQVWFWRVESVFLRSTNWLCQAIHSTTGMAIWPPKVGNKLLAGSWILVHQVAMWRFYACVYRRSFYRILNALARVSEIKFLGQRFQKLEPQQNRQMQLKILLCHVCVWPLALPSGQTAEATQHWGHVCMVLCTTPIRPKASVCEFSTNFLDILGRGKKKRFIWFWSVVCVSVQL